MRRPPKRPSSKLSTDSQRLVNLSQALAAAASRLEESAWERSLDLVLHKHLKNHHQSIIDGTLDHLFKSDLPAYDVLIEAVESNSEACALEVDGLSYSVQLLALPVLAWTRFSISSGRLPADLHNSLFAHLHAHVLAANARAALAPTLYAIEQLPRHHVEVFALTQRMGQAALKQMEPQLLQQNAPTAPFLADTRYLIAAVAVPNGAPIFRWQMEESIDKLSSPVDKKAAAIQAWNTQATPLMTHFLPGCHVELLLPQPYYFACREADKRIRAASIRAADHYLTHTLGVASLELHANIGSFYEDINGQIDEYRIGFSIGNSNDIVYGIVWPLYEQEDGDEMVNLPTPDSIRTPIEEILSILRECGIIHIKLHTQRYSMEFCDDCGTPLFIAADGDLAHAEMPDDIPASTEHFH